MSVIVRGVLKKPAAKRNGVRAAIGVGSVDRFAQRQVAGAKVAIVFIDIGIDDEAEGLASKAADIDPAAGDSREWRSALVESAKARGLRVVAGVEGRAAAQQRMRLCRSAIVGQWSKPGICHANLVAMTPSVKPPPKLG